MKKEPLSNNESFSLKSLGLPAVSPSELTEKGRSLPPQKLAEFLSDIKAKLYEGFSGEAKEICFEVLENYANSLNVQSRLIELAATALAMEGLFGEALEILKPFDSEEVINSLDNESLALLYNQQGILYGNLNNSANALKYLNMALRAAEDRDLTHVFVDIYQSFAIIYREQNEYPVSRNYAEKAMRFARELGDWRGLAESYRILATGYQQEGSSLKAIESFQQAVKIIGDRPASFLLGKIHSDLSASYLNLLRLPEGVESARKAVSLFEKTGQKFQLAPACNNLGVNLLLHGNWKKAEETLNRAADLALETDHTHLAEIVCSIAELNILRDNYAEADKFLTQALHLAEEKQRERDKIRILYNSARSLLARNEYDAAISQAEQASELCKKLREKYIFRLIELVLAEAFLKKKKLARTEEILESLEKEEIESSYLVLGGIARIRALAAFAAGEDELAIHHFSRSLAIYEIAGDKYHSALVNYDIGKKFIEKQSDRALESLSSAIETFNQIGASTKARSAESILGKVNKKAVPEKREYSVNSQLLMLRLIEAVSSRELLFREFLTVLRQDSKAAKILLAEAKDGRAFQVSSFEGFTSQESAQLIIKLNEAVFRRDLEAFSRQKNFSLLQLWSPNSTPAMLLLSPPSAAVLKDGSSLQPLCQVVELGMEVCALREHSIATPNPLISNISPLESQGLMPGFIHSSPAMMEIVDEILKIGSSDVIVLITGESGTGKELIARAVHSVSRRKNKVFVPFNCTAVPRELTEGHLFGYKKGSFTGAVADSEGMIRAADGGTLFLDEIGDLPLDVQPKILRFLQEGEVQPLGEKAPKRVDVRIIAATNMNLEERVSQGLFREDLYYRLNVIRLRVPPLRDRRSEIPQLVNYYVNHYSAKFGRHDLMMSSEAMDLLIAYDWKGNVRQLCNEVQRIVARSNSGDRISPLHLSNELRSQSNSANQPETGNLQAYGLHNGAVGIQTEGRTLDESVSALEIQIISDSLERHKNNISRVARELGLTRRGLYMKLDRYKLRSS